MLLEAIIMTVCVSNQGGCGESTSAYYQQSQDLQRISKNAEKIGKHIVKDEEWLIFLAAPAAAIASHQPAKIFLYKGTTLNVDAYKSSAMLEWNY